MGSAYSAADKNQVDTERRSFTDVGVFLEPTGVLGESAGVSSVYHASVRNDSTDALFTTVAVGKCGETEECRCDERGCAEALFAPRRRAWRKGGAVRGARTGGGVRRDQ